MKIGIIGSGAIGALLGGHLTRAGEDVIMFDTWRKHIEIMREEGLLMDGDFWNIRV